MVSHLAGCSASFVDGNCGYHRHRLHSNLETQTIVFFQKKNKFLRKQSTKDNLLTVQTTICSTCGLHVTEPRVWQEMKSYVPYVDGGRNITTLSKVVRRHNYGNNNTAHEVGNKEGRPSVSYETESTKSKKKN